eukprot:TRINITY_DN16982_c0_g1_i1.p1 TRINITY_DN16982_c0_g1~~TRINITY_DN16982_c0_g1_i1.p1  ORF type:complete len:1511 (-),score=233.62 TRINITY_DN16982_c0_g1_i1:373-4905(-)
MQSSQGEETGHDFANVRDFRQLRVAQLKKACRDAGLGICGPKADLAQRLADLQTWKQHDVLALRQTFGSKAAPNTFRFLSPQETRKQHVIAKAKSKSAKPQTRRNADTNITELALRRLLWAIEDEALPCTGCGQRIQHRNGRFGLFLCCGAHPPCGHFENLAKAVLRLGGADEDLPVRITLELEDLVSVRLHAQGSRDCASLRALALDAGLGPEAHMRPDWITPNSQAKGQQTPSTSTESLGQAAGISSSHDDAGIGLMAGGEMDLVTPERVSFLLSVSDRPVILQRLRDILSIAAAATGGHPGDGCVLSSRLDDLSTATLAFLTRATQKSEPVGQGYIRWAAGLLGEVVGMNWQSIHAKSGGADPSSSRESHFIDDMSHCQDKQAEHHSDLPRTRRELITLLREGKTKDGRLLWEWEVICVASAIDYIQKDGLEGPESIGALVWERLGEIVKAEQILPQVPVNLPPEPASSKEADWLLARALTLAPQLDALRPFQREGVRRALHLGGRCLLADEMGCGKSPQALGVLAAYNAWPALIICPAFMRLAWAEEIENWLPAILRPRNIHIIFSSNDMLPQSRSPGSLGDIRVCIVSFSMARLLYENLSGRSWQVVIVDESHCLRAVGGKPSIATQAVLALLANLPRILLLSGTPSHSNYLDVYTQANLLSPGLLGSWREFVADYDEPALSASGHLVPGRCRRSSQLALLLREGVMVRRRKREVLAELPPKRRRFLRLALSPEATSALSDHEAATLTDYERCGLLKSAAAENWFVERLEQCQRMGEKTVAFAHHIRVLDRLCRSAESREIPFIRIDGSSPALTRQTLINRFQNREPGSPVLAVIGVTACGAGVNLSAASLAVFAELPPDASWLCQAEDRLHRRGQQRAVDVVLLLAHDRPVGRARPRNAKWTHAEVSRCCDADVYRWKSLRGRLAEVTALHDGPAACAANLNLASCAHKESVVQETCEQPVSCCSAIVAEPSQSLQFRFELSPYTSRLHLHLESRSLGCSVRPEEGGQEAADRVAKIIQVPQSQVATQLMSQAAEFRAAWLGLSPYQQRLAKGVEHDVTSLASQRPEAPPLSGSRSRFVLRRQSSTDADEASADDLPRCEVRVEYLHGRLSGQVLTFLQPVSLRATHGAGARQRKSPPGDGFAESPATSQKSCQLLCMECLTTLDMDMFDTSPELLAEPSKGPSGEEVTHKSDIRNSEESLFCTGSCRARYFGKRSGGSLRRQLFELERGICQSCGIDCHSVFQSLLTASPGPRRHACLSEVAPRIASNPILASRILEAQRVTEGLLWQADHIVPVWEGGGMCGVENLQSLCVACHAAKTSSEASQRANRRQTERKDASPPRQSSDRGKVAGKRVQALGRMALQQRFEQQEKSAKHNRWQLRLRSPRKRINIDQPVTCSKRHRPQKKMPLRDTPEPSKLTQTYPSCTAQTCVPMKCTAQTWSKKLQIKSMTITVAPDTSSETASHAMHDSMSREPGAACSPELRSEIRWAGLRGSDASIDLCDD